MALPTFRSNELCVIQRAVRTKAKYIAFPKELIALGALLRGHHAIDPGGSTFVSQNRVSEPILALEAAGQVREASLRALFRCAMNVLQTSTKVRLAEIALQVRRCEIAGNILHFGRRMNEPDAFPCLHHSGCFQNVHQLRVAPSQAIWLWISLLDQINEQLSDVSGRFAARVITVRPLRSVGPYTL